MDFLPGDKIKLIKFDKNKIFLYPIASIKYHVCDYTNEIGEIVFIDTDNAFRVNGFSKINWACKEMVELLPNSISNLLRRRACSG